jgi:L,D-transpeptidase ErfK/SrfK
MMVLFRVFLSALFLVTISAHADSRYYNARLCNMTNEYTCHHVKRHETWERLFPNPTQQDIVMRVNRMGIQLEPGMRIAIPKNLDNASAMQFAPFAQQISPPGERIVIVSTSEQAWGAYDQNGVLLRWGPTSTARGYCPDIGHGCHTALGKFAVYEKQGKGCFSTKYPVGRGGAPMPYCMFFHGGFALHGSYEVPGYNASHGCVRMMVDDAKWLNEEFVEIGTPVIVKQ